MTEEKLYVCGKCGVLVAEREVHYGQHGERWVPMRQVAFAATAPSVKISQTKK